MIEFFHKALAFVRAHKVAFGVGGGGLVVAGTVVSLVKRKKAAAIGEQVVAKLQSVLGTPYIWGSRDPVKGLDCSGAVVWALRDLGLEPKKWNATAADLYKQSSMVLIPQVGDLVFYGPLGGVDHVMVYLGDGKVIGASGGGSSTTTVAEAQAKNAAVKVLPIDYRSDRRGVGRLPVQTATDAVVGTLHMLGSR